MKKITLLFICLFSITILQAQCTQPASNFGNNVVPGYDVSGDVDVVLNSDNTVTVNLGNNFSTAPGPDVRIYLLDRRSLSDNQLKSPSNFLSSPRLELGLISPFQGASSYTVTIPSNVNISDYQTVFFYCLQFNQFWDFGSYTSFDTSNCTTLSNDTIDATTQFSIFPNPAVDSFNLINDSSSSITSLIIYDILGKEVYMHEGVVTENIDIQSLDDGTYFVKIMTEENLESTIKLLKRSI